ncbi:MAG: hypothetical protein RLZZ324_273 [Candidatus Parcubacteria bacterium]|jgi:hypothetical protein
MFIFVDEAGDTGLKFAQGSSRFFTVALVMFTDETVMQACDGSIGELRLTLGKHERFEFHFHDNKPDVRRAFIKTVCQFDFSYIVCSIDKHASAVRGAEFDTKDALYAFAVKIAFGHARPYTRGAYVVIDQSGSHEFQAALSKHVKTFMNTNEDQVIRKFRAERSSQNNLIQLADYVASICHRKISEKPDADAYYGRILSKEKRSSRWP